MANQDKYPLYSKLLPTFEQTDARANALQIIREPLSKIALVGARDLDRIKPISRHPLGFYTLQFGFNDDDGAYDGVCLHLWPDSDSSYRDHEPFPDNTTDFVHAHSWEGNFLNLDGKIGNQHVDVDDNLPATYVGGLTRLPEWASGGNYYRIFDARTGPHWDVMYNTNRVAKIISEHDTEWIEPGQTYGVKVGNYHISSWDRDSVTLSLSYNHPRRRNHTLGPLIKVAETDEVDTHIVERLRYSPERTVEIAGQIATRLGLD
jgi:hypothetical protein